MRKRRSLWTPNEVLEAAKAAFESSFGEDKPTPVAPAQKQPKPVLLSRPKRPVQKLITISQLRKAQRAERRRARFNKTVRKAVAQQSKALTAQMKAQVKAAKAAYRAAVKQQRARAQAALVKAEKAQRAAETLRKQVQAARGWLRIEALRQRALDKAAKSRIARAKARNFRPLEYHSPEWEWGNSCPLFRIRGLAAAAALVWAAETK